MVTRLFPQLLVSYLPPKHKRREKYDLNVVFSFQIKSFLLNHSNRFLLTSWPDLATWLFQAVREHKKVRVFRPSQ